MSISDHYTGNGKVLNDLEVKIDYLERQNFDLKMQLFYLTQQENNPSSPNTESPIKFTHNNPEFEVEINNLRHENTRLKRLVSDYEAERLHATVAKGMAGGSSEGDEIEKQPVVAAKSQIAVDMTQFEENRKRERRAALAVAEHDRAVITHLEKEITRLLAQHTQDVDLVKRCSEQVGNKTEELRQKKAIITTKDEEVTSLRSKVDVMTDLIRHQELLLKEANDKQDILLNTIIDRDQQLVTASTSSHANNTNGKMLTKSPTSKPSTLSSQRPADPLSFTESILKSSASTTNQTQIHASTGMSTPTKASTSSGKAQSIEKSELMTMVSTIIADQLKQHKTAEMPKDLSSSKNGATLHHESDKQHDVLAAHFGSASGQSYVPLLSAQLDSGLSIHVDEINRLRRENAILRDQLDRGRFMLRSHEEILQKIRSSAEELTLLEAEEIARLSTEVERLTKDNKQLKEKSSTLAQEIQTQCKRIIDLERSQGATSHTTSHNSGKELKVGVDDVSILSKKQERLLDVYKKREAELLDALETVVGKCQALEAKAVWR